MLFQVCSMLMAKFTGMKDLQVCIEDSGYLQSKLLAVSRYIQYNYISYMESILGVFYISTYEGVRHILKQHKVHSNIRALIAGAAASLVGQTIIVPFDVLSQHLMMMGINGKGQEKVYIPINVGIFITFILLGI